MVVGLIFYHSARMSVDLALLLTAVLYLVQPSSAGINYVRWGRTTCANGASLLYQGFALGSYYGQAGNGANSLCVPQTPQWANVVPGNQAWTGYLYGVVYNLLGYGQNNQPFSFANNNGQSFHFLRVPCAVCYQPSRRAVLMISGRVNCTQDGWSTEYSGYLVSEDRLRYKSEYSCLDSAPEGISSGAYSDVSRYLQPVQAKCGSLQCPKYVDGYEIACAVCSI